MEQKLEIRKFIWANTTPFFGWTFTSRLKKKKKKEKKKKKKETLAVRLFSFKPKKGHVSLHVYLKLLNTLVTRLSIVSFLSHQKVREIKLILSADSIWQGQWPNLGLGSTVGERASFRTPILLVNWTEAQNELKLDNKLFSYSWLL